MPKLPVNEPCKGVPIEEPSVKTHDVDLLIVGGGMGACGVAYEAVRWGDEHGLKIMLCDKAALERSGAVAQGLSAINTYLGKNTADDYVRMADTDDKEVWYSEGCATFGYSELQENKTIAYGANSIGGYQSPLALMDSFITAFASSRRTHYIFQPAIGSFYEGIQYGHKELLSARDPWSGYIHYDPALSMLEHFAKFAKTGWEDSDPSQNDIWRAIPGATINAFAGSDNEHATAGINGNAGCLTLASPDKKDFSVVFVNNTRNPKSFFINTQDMAVTADSLHFWLTETDHYLQDKGTIESADNGWYVTLPAYSIATATTLDTPKMCPKRTSITRTAPYWTPMPAAIPTASLTTRYCMPTTLNIPRSLTDTCRNAATSRAICWIPTAHGLWRTVSSNKSWQAPCRSGTAATPRR
jgi:hypothetical protein